MFLGVDGGGTKTAYALIDGDGVLRARHVGPSVSHLAVGFAGAKTLLSEGIARTLALAAAGSNDIVFAFLGLPAYGEDSVTTPQLDALPATVLDTQRYKCGNDMICSWAGALGCEDGISVIAGTGSMAYGEYRGRAARAGGWGELIGDEGSAFWIAREGMNLFSRMSDGRATRGALYELVRSRCGLDADLDLCSKVYGVDANTRSAFAQFAPLVHEAALAGDVGAVSILQRGAERLVECVVAVRTTLSVPATLRIPVSHTGSVLSGATLMLDAFRSFLAKAPMPFEYREPAHSPDVGAALYAARLAQQPLTAAAIERLKTTA